MMNELIPFMEKGERVTATPSAAVTGKRFVSISGDKTDGNFAVAPTGAAGKVFGVATWDAAVDVRVTVITIPSGYVVPVTTGEAIAAGDSVASGANGVAVVAASGASACGIALTGAASGADAVIQLTNHTA